MNGGQWTDTSRELEVITIPDGQKVKLPPKTSVCVMQSLGGSYTIQTDMGYLVRVDGKDGDAIGLSIIQDAVSNIDPSAITPEEVGKLAWEQLKGVFDPEIPANIVDLGLVYKCETSQIPDNEGYMVDVVMTLTAPGCGMGDILKMDAESRIRKIPGVKVVSVHVVTEPAWNPSMMSEAAKLDLGMM